VDNQWIESVQTQMPELPDEKRQRFITQYGLSDYDADVLTSAIELANFFEQAAAPVKDKKQAANWVMTSLLGLLKSKSLTITESPVNADAFSRLLRLIEDGKINANAAKTVFEEMALSGKDPQEIVAEKGLEQVSDQSELETLVMQIIEENPAEVNAYREGKTKLFSFFMGQIMKKTRGKADPKIVGPLLKNNL